MPQGDVMFIRSKLTGFVMDVEGANGSPGTKVIMWPQKEDTEPNQLWRQDHVRGCIVSELNPDLVLTVEDGKLRLGEYNGEDCCRWFITYDDGDREKGVIRNHGDSNKVLDIEAASESEGADIIGYDYHGNANQLWQFDYLEPRYFRIHSKMHGKVITCHEDVKLKMFDADDENEQQLWYINPHGVLCCKSNTLCMCSKKGYGKKMKMSEFHDEEECLWMVDGDRICNRNNREHVLDIKGENEDDGAKVIVYEDNGQDNQRWEIKYV